jgi:hypothetical protein
MPAGPPTVRRRTFSRCRSATNSMPVNWRYPVCFAIAMPTYHPLPVSRPCSYAWDATRTSEKIHQKPRNFWAIGKSGRRLSGSDSSAFRISSILRMRCISITEWNVCNVMEEWRRCPTHPGPRASKWGGVCPAIDNKGDHSTV